MLSEPVPASDYEEQEDDVASTRQARGWQYTPTVPIRIEIQMFKEVSGVTAPILEKLVQFYHAVAASLSRADQREYLAMLRGLEWRITQRRAPSAHTVLRHMREQNSGAAAETVFFTDHMSLPTLAILMATYPNGLGLLAKLGVFAAFAQYGIGYTTCREGYVEYHSTELEAWEPPSIQELATMADVKVRLRPCKETPRKKRRRHSRGGTTADHVPTEETRGDDAINSDNQKPMGASIPQMVAGDDVDVVARNGAQCRQCQQQRAALAQCQDALRNALGRKHSLEETVAAMSERITQLEQDKACAFAEAALDAAEKESERAAKLRDEARRRAMLAEWRNNQDEGIIPFYTLEEE
ncbi:hypothetical protein A9K55_008040 [Cordyceps militaris]|uniref:Uncharacterized protein n=1 Tax=Cordyceps militaris TaxID=73501 RepID=A0A2H4SGQ6_CORMI|nr:hypothetical protein A9K55_008040 [Cordyceps militaris]